MDNFEEPASLFPVDMDMTLGVPVYDSSSLQIFVQLAENPLFVAGFDEHQCEDKPPTLLRGVLVLKVFKSIKLKNVNMTLKGVSRTDWPEGIPPKKNEFHEDLSIVSHTWPFYQHGDSDGHGEAMFKPLADDDVHSVASPIGSPISSFLRRAASPAPSRASGSLLGALERGNRSSDSMSILSGASVSADAFDPGEYHYTFEHALPQSFPETIKASFGNVEYNLEITVDRVGAFKPSIHCKLPLTVIRTPSDSSVEDTEPIAISKAWEDHLHYDVVIASKDIILNAFLPVAFKLTPLDKVMVHRIRIYLTETMEYYCRNKKVHRTEPTKKYLLLEHKAPPLPDLPSDADPNKAKNLDNLLLEHGDLVSKEFEYHLYVPEKIKNHKIHPDTNYANIKSNHWIKIGLRLSKMVGNTRKHFEISIDSPIHVLDPLCSHANTLLPAYGGLAASQIKQVEVHKSNIYFPEEVLSPPMSPEVEHHNHRRFFSPVRNREREMSPIRSPELEQNMFHPDHLSMNLASPQALPVSPIGSPIMRPIHLIRRPSFDPPAFEEDVPPPSMDDMPSHPPTYDTVLEEDGIVPQGEASAHNNADGDIASGFSFAHKKSPSLNFHHMEPNYTDINAVLSLPTPEMMARPQSATVMSQLTAALANTSLGEASLGPSAMSESYSNNDTLVSHRQNSTSPDSLREEAPLDEDFATMTPLLQKTTTEQSIMTNQSDRRDSFSGYVNPSVDFSALYDRR